MLDIRTQLERSKTVPQTSRKGTGFVTIHWNGPAIGNKPDMTVLKQDAYYHVHTKGWDGLSYHFGVGKTEQYLCRDWSAKLAHSGVTQGNDYSLSVLVITGDGDQLPTSQTDNLESLLQGIKISPRYVLGHQEWPRTTLCPGALLLRWLDNYRHRYSDTTVRTTRVMYNANVRDMPAVSSAKVGSKTAGQTVTGRWVLGKPVKGDCLWFQIVNTTDYIHASALDASSYRNIYI